MHMLRFRSTEPCTKTRGASVDRSSKTTFDCSRHYIKLFSNPLSNEKRKTNENGYRLLCVGSRRFVSEIQLVIRVKLPFTFWSLDGVIFQCRQKNFNTVINKLKVFLQTCCYSLSMQNPRTNWVSVVWKLGEICYFF